MIYQPTEKSQSDTESNFSPDSAAGSTNKNSRLVLRLLADAKNLLKDSYSEEEFKQAFAIIKSAKSRGFLGAHKSSDCCLAESINIANEILRTRNREGIEASAITKQTKAIYIYVALVALGLIPA